MTESQTVSLPSPLSHPPIQAPLLPALPHPSPPPKLPAPTPAIPMSEPISFARPLLRSPSSIAGDFDSDGGGRAVCPCVRAGHGPDGEAPHDFAETRAVAGIGGVREGELTVMAFSKALKSNGHGGLSLVVRINGRVRFLISKRCRRPTVAVAGPKRRRSMARVGTAVEGE
jgi:hypothetical protein